MIKKTALYTLSVIAVLVILNSASPAQMTVSGEVVDVVDGKTVVIAMPTGRVKAELQYIDIPEPSQSLYATVKDHLAKLVLGKTVEYRALTLLADRTVGRMMLNNVDVSLQMLRDGAAWHDHSAGSGQESGEMALYAATEKTAREEKRGVWAVNGLNPSSELRANKPSSLPKPTPPVRETMVASVTKPPVRRGYWSDKNPALGDVGVLANGYNAEARSGYVGTSMLGVKDADPEKPSDARTGVDITYFYKETGQNKRKGVFVVTVVSESAAIRFLAHNDLTVICDDKKMLVGKPKREASTGSGWAREKLTYQIDRSVLDKIVNGNEVILKVGDYLIKPEAGLQMLLYNLLQISE